MCARCSLRCPPQALCWRDVIRAGSLWIVPDRKVQGCELFSSRRPPSLPSILPRATSSRSRPIWSRASPRTPMRRDVARARLSGRSPVARPPCRPWTKNSASSSKPADPGWTACSSSSVSTRPNNSRRWRTTRCRRCPRMGPRRFGAADASGGSSAERRSQGTRARSPGWMASAALRRAGRGQGQRARPRPGHGHGDPSVRELARSLTSALVSSKTRGLLEVGLTTSRAAPPPRRP